MLSLYDQQRMLHALSLPLDPELHALLSERIAALDRTDLIELTHFIVMEEGDREVDLINEIGFSPLVNAIDRRRYRSNGFVPSWDWLYDHGGWFEMIVAIGNSGFAYVLFMPNDDRLDPDLLSLCRAYTDTQTQPSYMERSL